MTASRTPRLKFLLAIVMVIAGFTVAIHAAWTALPQAALRPVALVAPIGTDHDVTAAIPAPDPGQSSPRMGREACEAVLAEGDGRSYDIGLAYAQRPAERFTQGLSDAVLGSRDDAVIDGYDAAIITRLLRAAGLELWPVTARTEMHMSCTLLYSV